MQLRETQEKLQHAITRFKHEGFPELSFIENGPPLNVTERLSIYSEDWFERLRESLFDDFELLANEIGHARFTQLVQDFVRTQPPSRFEMNGMGDAIPEFFATRPEALERPWLVDLARIERAYYQAGYAADHDPRGFGALQGATPEAVASVRIGIGPSVTLVRTDWDLASYWNEESVSEPARLAAPQTLIVFREGFSTDVQALGTLDAVALELLCDGMGLNEFLEQEFEVGAEEFYGASLAQNLGEWATRGWICLKS